MENIRIPLIENDVGSSPLEELPIVDRIKERIYIALVQPVTISFANINSVRKRPPPYNGARKSPSVRSGGRYHVFDITNVGIQLPPFFPDF